MKLESMQGCRVRKVAYRAFIFSFIFLPFLSVGENLNIHRITRTYDAKTATVLDNILDTVDTYVKNKNKNTKITSVVDAAVPVILPFSKYQYIEFANQEAANDFVITNQIEEGKNNFAFIDSKWLYGSASIESVFNDGNRRDGMGLLLPDGLFLTSLELIYNANKFSKDIYVKMRDDSANVLIYIAKLHIVAVDVDSGLALLNISEYTDSYGKPRPLSFYQKRILDTYYVDIFRGNVKAAQGVDVYYPKITDLYGFTLDKTLIQSDKNYYNFELRERLKYGYAVKIDSYNDKAFGKPYFDRNGNFVGILSVTAVDYSPSVVSKDVIVNFICNISNDFSQSNSYINKSCEKINSRYVNYFAVSK